MTDQSASGPRVLLVDDDEKLRHSLRGVLEDHGIEVVGEAGDGVEGVALSWKLSPDVVLMDYRMPGMNGIQAVEEIKQSSADTEIILLSAHEETILQTDAGIAGAIRYVVKGAPVSTILSSIKEAWRAKQEEAAG